MPLNNAGSSDANGGTFAAGRGATPWTGCVGERTGAAGRVEWAWTRLRVAVVRMAMVNVVRRVMPDILPGVPLPAGGFQLPASGFRLLASGSRGYAPAQSCQRRERSLRVL